ncbi:hypothetical protein [Rhodococcus marinonascens]|uniref:hypothetical protein n=1 Tax=Rhodococcus marinonascens TaxID=38311 RepID=UPI000B12A1B9|nr:hypothetical protein [Rhodococcus marinonascens]
MPGRTSGAGPCIAIKRGLAGWFSIVVEKLSARAASSRYSVDALAALAHQRQVLVGEPVNDEIVDPSCCGT